MFKAQIENILKNRIRQMSALHGGSIAQVYRIDLEDGETVVAKVSNDGNLHIEGDMLRDLGGHLPVPDVIHAEPSLLVMAYVPGNSNITADVQGHAAELVAKLHGVRGESFGYPHDTLIGGLHQPNPTGDSWVAFFRDHRLLYMAKEAVRVGQLSSNIMRRIDSFAARVADFIDEPPYPSLLHGDLWTTNILARDGRVTGFIDPAVYYGHPEIELAFSTLFGTFDKPFFQRYAAIRGIEPGFFESRRDIYNLYPLLVHVRLFGAGYVGSVDAILRRHGF